MKRKSQQDLPAAASDGTESWLIHVLVGGGGDEVRISMGPEGSIGQLLDHVRAEKGVRGTLVGTTSGEELQPMHTLRASGLAHEAEVYLQIRQAFEEERQFLIALRDSSNFERWGGKQKAGWADLDRFTEPEQLSACAGVTVGDGEITALDLRGNRAIERKLLSNSYERWNSVLTRITL